MLTRQRSAATAWFAVAALLVVPAAPATAADTPYVITACVQGGVLAGATPAASDTSARAFAPRYRLAGKKALVKEIKKDHADHVDEFTGTITGDDMGGAPMKLGKLSVRVGAAQGSPNAPYVPETPVFEVKSFRHLEGKCR